MNLKSLKLTNFKLFKEESFSFDKINIINGENYSGKSTVLKSIIFGLYGEASGTKLDRLISFGEDKTTVELECDKLRIVRSVPNTLEIYDNDKEVDFNTISLKQEYLDKQLKDYEFFKKYRLINKNSINILDYAKDSRSIVTLRKELMSFIDTDFTDIRKSLLDKKLVRETYSKDKRLYQFYLSDKKKTALENGLKQCKEEVAQTKKEVEDQQTVCSDLKTEIQKQESTITVYKKNIESIKKAIEENTKEIKNYKEKINKLKAIPEVSKIVIVDYNEKIKKSEKDIEENEAQLTALALSIKTINKNIEAITLQNNSYKVELKNNEQVIIKLDKEIAGLNRVAINTKCDKCGSVVSEEQRNSYKSEKEKELKEFLEKSEQIQSSIDKNKIHGIDKECTKLKGLENLEKSTTIEVNTSKKELKELTIQNLKQVELLGKRETEVATLDSEISKIQELISTCEQRNSALVLELSLSDEIEQLSYKIEQEKEELVIEEDALNHYKKVVSIAEAKEKRTQLLYSKLQEAFKFVDYKYSKADIELYTASIKVLDEFSGWYINVWLDNLSIIINDLLKGIGLSVVFSADKQFLTITENSRELDYNDLSGGQQIFLSVIFKLSILLQNGITDGVVILDEGLGELKLNNLHKLLDVLKTLPFQLFLVYQNIDEIEGVNTINIIRDGNISYKGDK